MPTGDDSPIARGRVGPRRSTKPGAVDTRFVERSRAFWDTAARTNAAWHVATGHTSTTDAFFEQGCRETDEFLRFTDTAIASGDTVLEIGCGVGRMTGRLAELSGKVVATDISQAMLERCKQQLSGRANVEYSLVSGDGSLPMPDSSVDVVFSYVTLQHVPTRDGQLRYLQESARVLRPGGRLAVQIRATGVAARAHDWAGHLAHLGRGRRTLCREWRGTRVTPGQIRDALAPSRLDVELRQWNHRHVWVVGRKK